MFNYYSQFKSNYFKVKDLEKFKDWLPKLEGSPDIQEDEDGSITIFSVDGGIPQWEYSDDGEEFEIDFWKELSGHLKDGQVAVFVQIGYVKAHTDCCMLAVHSDGRWKNSFPESFITEICDEWDVECIDMNI